MPYMMVKRIVRDCKPLEYDANGLSFGAQIDKALAKAAHEGEELAEISFGFEGDEWHSFQRSDMGSMYRDAHENEDPHVPRKAR